MVFRAYIPWTMEKFARGLALSFVSMAAGGVLAATIFAAMARARTWVHLGIAGFAILGGVVLWSLVKRSRRAVAVVIALAVVRLAVAIAPRTSPVISGALVKTRFVGSRVDRLWFAGIPEIETVRLGARAGLLPNEFEHGFPAIVDAYSDHTGFFEREESPLLDSWFCDREHFWLATPASPQKVPLIVFVHGNGGNFQFYPRLLAREAVGRGFAIAFPSNGLGNWRGKDAAERIGRVVDAVSREVDVDRKRVSLVGLSSGGLGVVAAARFEPERYRNIVVVSGIFPDLAGFSTKAHISILHGTKDARARIGNARTTRDVLVSQGISVDFFEDDADHLALLTRKETWVPLLFSKLSR